MGVKTPKNLRSIGGVKIYIIAVVWAMTTVVLPVLESKLALNMNHWILVVQRIFIVIVLMLPFEIRDLDEDQVHLSTIPQKIGIKNTKIIGFALLGDSILLEFFKHQFSQNIFLTACFIGVLSAVLLAKSQKQQGRYYASFLGRIHSCFRSSFCGYFDSSSKDRIFLIRLLILVFALEI